ncbi:MAG: hypothetical protein R2854_19530 [Caldilineaceae bacterium]
MLRYNPDFRADDLHPRGDGPSDSALVCLAHGVTPEAQLQTENNVEVANKAVVETYFGQVLSQGDGAAADAILAPGFARIDRSQAGVELGRAGTEFLASYYQLPEVRPTPSTPWRLRGTRWRSAGRPAAWSAPIRSPPTPASR